MYNIRHTLIFVLLYSTKKVAYPFFSIKRQLQNLLSRKFDHIILVYNPQNEMFSHLGTKRYNFKNETQLFKVIPHTSKFQKNRPASPERNTFEGS